MNKKIGAMICMMICVLVVGWIVYTILFSVCAEGLEEQGLPHAPLRCGVDLPTCHGDHVRCINGYCRSDVASVLPHLSDLPMSP